MSLYIVKNKTFKAGMIDGPVDIDDQVGLLMLQAMGVESIN